MYVYMFCLYISLSYELITKDMVKICISHSKLHGIHNVYSSFCIYGESPNCLKAN